jgi:hypothetical protein
MGVELVSPLVEEHVDWGMFENEVLGKVFNLFSGRKEIFNM